MPIDNRRERVAFDKVISGRLHAHACRVFVFKRVKKLTRRIGVSDVDYRQNQQALLWP